MSICCVTSRHVMRAVLMYKGRAVQRRALRSLATRGRATGAQGHKRLQETRGGHSPCLPCNSGVKLRSAAPYATKQLLLQQESGMPRALLRSTREPRWCRPAGCRRPRTFWKGPLALQTGWRCRQPADITGQEVQGDRYSMVAYPVWCCRDQPLASYQHGAKQEPSDGSISRQAGRGRRGVEVPPGGLVTASPP